MNTFVVEINTGIVEATQLGIDWWTYFASIYRDSGRMVWVKPPCVIGGLVQVACDSEDHAHWLAEHMVGFGELPQSAVKVKRVAARVPA